MNDAETKRDVSAGSGAHHRGEQPPMPIVVGVERSGTTLLRLMLDAHPELAVAHETGFMPSVYTLINPFHRAFYARLRDTIRRGDWRHGLRDEFYRTLVKQWNWNDFHVPAKELKESLLRLKPFTVGDGLRCFFRLYAARFGKPRWGDKTPFYCQHLTEIARMLPEAHFIHIIRDGRDAARSIRGLRFAPGSDMETLASDWSRKILAARRQARRCPHYMEVRYEELILNTREVLVRICDFVKLGYEESMEVYHERARDRMNELETVRNRDGTIYAKEERFNFHRLTTEPPQRERIGRWKTELSRDEIAAFNRVAGNLLKELGYEV